MGTNYYAIPKATKELKEKIIAAVNEERWDDVRTNTPHRIHIGKSSGGWKFLFNHNNWNFFTDRETLETFLLGCRLEDEYYDPVSHDEFWRMVKAKEVGIDNKDYYTKRPSELHAGHNGNYWEEYHFGLRFSDSTEFS